MPLNKPAIDELAKKVDSRYTLVIESAKRARKLKEGDTPLLDGGNMKQLSLAVEEIDKNLLTYHRNLEDEEV